MGKSIIFVMLMIFGIILGSFSSYAEDLSGKVGVGVNISGIIPDDEEVENAVYVGGNVNYGVNKYLAVGVESGYRKSEVKLNGSNGGDLRGIPLLADVLVRVPTGESRFAPYGIVGIGAIFWDYKAANFLKNSGISIDIDTSFATKLGAGLDFFLTKHIALNIEGGYIWSRSDAKLKYSGGQSTERLKTDHWQIGGGLKYYF